jgi:4-aminobutyrate aminotransferase-like enzyme
MLGFGHNPDFLSPAVSRPQVMANVMTPSYSQFEFFNEWRKQVGFSRPSGNPYSRIMTMNSGSEAVELSARLTDVHAKLMTSPGAVHAGNDDENINKDVDSNPNEVQFSSLCHQNMLSMLISFHLTGRRSTMMVLQGSFYGRTYRPARLSHSCRDIYTQHLASFQHSACHLPIVVPANDVQALLAAFATAEDQNLHIEALYMEPVMGTNLHALSSVFTLPMHPPTPTNLDKGSRSIITLPFNPSYFQVKAIPVKLSREISTMLPVHSPRSTIPC